jgi:hypothetical protein
MSNRQVPQVSAFSITILIGCSLRALHYTVAEFIPESA